MNQAQFFKVKVKPNFYSLSLGIDEWMKSGMQEPPDELALGFSIKFQVSCRLTIIDRTVTNTISANIPALQ